jgi:Flp pilus assembly protein TadB
MIIIKIAFLMVFVLGMFLVVNPIVGRLAVGIMVMRRNRFYVKRRKDGKYDDKNSKNILQHPIILKLDEYLSVAEVRISSTHVLTMSLLIVIVVFLACYKVMPAPLYDIIIGVLFGGIPLLYCWSKYQKKTLAMASVMIPTVQNFIGYFTEADNLDGALYKSARTVPFEIMSEWNRLIMDMQTGENPAESLIHFAERLGNDWAHYFADILITHLDTGVDITSSLFKLINEMQNTMYNEEKRITLLTTYKWGTFLMIGLSAFVVYFNIRMDPENAKYYFHDKTGIQVVTLGVVVLFISFIGAMQMGRKKL